MAALKAVSSEPDTVEAMERLMIAHTSALEARLEAKFAQTMPVPADTLKSIVTRLTAAPTNWHQSVVYFATLPREDVDAARAWLAMAASVLMVLGQCLVAVGVFVGTATPSCENNDQCTLKGAFCFADESRCQFCSASIPIDNPVEQVLEPATLNRTLVEQVCAEPTDRTFIEWRCTTACYDHTHTHTHWERHSVASWCAACVHPLDMTVNPVTIDSHTAANVAAMGGFDWVALLLATFTVALTVIAELKDIALVAIAVRHGHEKLRPSWRFALALIGAIRRWVFLQALVLSVPFLVLLRGGDALSVCFNTVAVLFLCEIDNFTYVTLLNERVRSRIEERGRLELCDTEVKALARSNAAHVGFLMVNVSAFVWVANTEFMLIPLSAFWLAAMVEVFFDHFELKANGSLVQTCARIAKVTGAWSLGIFAWFSLWGGSWGGS